MNIFADREFYMFLSYFLRVDSQVLAQRVLRYTVVLCTWDLANLSRDNCPSSFYDTQPPKQIGLYRGSKVWVTLCLSERMAEFFLTHEIFHVFIRNLK